MAKKDFRSGLQSRLNDLEVKVEDLVDGTFAGGDITCDSLVVQNTVEADTVDAVAVQTADLAITADVTPVNAVAAQATIVYNNAVDATAGKVVTINGKAYKFVAGPVSVEGDVLIGANADATFTNLARAINKSGGTPDTDYKVALAHPTVAASINAGTDTITLAARVKGVAGNALTLTSNEATVTLSAATFGAPAQVGVDGTVGVKGAIVWDASYIYVCTAANTIADSNWKRLGNTLAGF